MNTVVYFHTLFAMPVMGHLFVCANSCLLPSFVPLLSSLSEPSQADTTMLIMLGVRDSVPLGIKTRLFQLQLVPS